MSKTRFGATLALLATLGLAAGCGSDDQQSADSDPSKGDLPAARDVIDRHITALGGADAILAQNVGTATGYVEYMGANSEASVTTIGASETARVTIMNLPGMGEVRSGIHGEHVWSFDPVNGAQLFDASESAMQREVSLPEAALRGERFVSSVETLGLSQVEGEPCYQVKVLWRSGRESVDCYSQASGLLIGTQVIQDTPMGKITIDTRFADYREFDGVKVAARTLQSVMGNAQLMMIESLDLTPPDPALVEPPAAVKALIEQRTIEAQNAAEPAADTDAGSSADADADADADPAASEAPDGPADSDDSGA